MRSIKINKNGALDISGEIINISSIENPEKFFQGLLMLDVEIGKDVTLGDLIHFSYNLKGFIKNFFCEEYEVVRVLTNVSKISKNIESIRLYKSFRIETEFQEEKEFVYLIPEIEVKYGNEKRYEHLCDVPIIIDESVSFSYNDIKIETNSKLSLLDLMTCMYDELTDYIQQNNIISPLA